MLAPFKVLKSENEPTVDGIDYTVLINTEHITSLKPINIPFAGNIISGYWIRLLNGKKYKASRIPLELMNLLEKDSDLSMLVMNGESHNSLLAH